MSAVVAWLAAIVLTGQMLHLAVSWLKDLHISHADFCNMFGTLRLTSRSGLVELCQEYRSIFVAAACLLHAADFAMCLAVAPMLASLNET